MKDPSTTELVRRAQGGDPTAYEQLVRRHLRSAYAVALSMTRAPADAEDIAQEAFIVALEKLDTLREPERFSSWLLQIVRNRARNALDRRKVRVAHVSRTIDERAEEAQRNSMEGTAGLRGRLLRALATLTPIQRMILLLHDLDEWTHPEIAAELEITEGNSRQHLFQGRKALRKRLEDDGPQETSS